MSSLAPADACRWSRRKLPFKTLEKKLHAVLVLGGCAAVEFESALGFRFTLKTDGSV